MNLGKNHQIINPGSRSASPLRILHFALCIATSVISTANAVEITEVSARQRWPWNNLVDIDFTIVGAAGEAYAIDVTATAAGGEKRLCATSFATEPIATSGTNRIVWDLGTDYPNFKADDLAITVTATPFSAAASVYLVVDVSGGTAAAKWPVRYTTAAPVHTPGVADPCKTTELWLKRVKAGTGTDGSGTGGGNAGSGYYAEHTYILTNDYYIGVFSLTQAQCMNIWGNYESLFTNEAYRATRPVDSIDPKYLRAPYFDSANPDVPLQACIMKNLRDRTGLKFDLPTEWQWAYACMAGESGGRYTGATDNTIRHSGNSQPPATYEFYGTQGMWSADYGTSYVDAYLPNPWGIYGMLGNVWEACLNRQQTIAQGGTYTDPMGNGGGTALEQRTRRRRGSCWTDKKTAAQSYITSIRDAWSYHPEWTWGARICLTIGR